MMKEPIYIYNNPFTNLLNKYGAKHKVSIPYHPQTKGKWN